MYIEKNQITRRVFHDFPLQIIASCSFVCRAYPFTLILTQELAQKVVLFLYHIIFQGFHAPSSVAVEAGISGFHVNSCAVCGCFYLIVSYFGEFIPNGAAHPGKKTFINPVSFDIHITFRGRFNKWFAVIGVVKIKLKLT